MNSRITALFTVIPWRALRVACAVVLVFAGAGMVMLTPSYPQVIPQGLFANTIAPRISDADMDAYANAFNAVADAEYDALGEILRGVHNPALHGYVLAEKYLQSNYSSTPNELRAWLEHYADHPQAKQVAALAARKGVNVRASDYSKKALKGSGYAYHLGRSSPPRDWYRGLKAWRGSDYKTAEAHFVKVGNAKNASKWHRSAGYFWAARAAAKLEKRQSATAYQKKAASFPDTLYGALAEHAVYGGQAIRVAAPFVPRQLQHSNIVIRARALAALGRTRDAEKELRHLTMALPKSARPAVVTLAAELGLANLQMRLERLKGLDEDAQRLARYPMPEGVVQASGAIDPALVLAIARHESAFNVRAGSEMGATGLMQLMPATANALLREERFQTVLASADASNMLSSSIRDPWLNVRLGAYYIEKLQSKPRVGNSLIHVLAAYNAGPGNVSSWHSRAKHISDPLLYIESIPFPETRNYVLQTLHHQSVYQQLMGRNASALQDILDGAFPPLTRS